MNCVEKKSGFSLVEVLVSFVLGALFISIVAQSYQVFVKNIEKTQREFLLLYRFEEFCLMQQYRTPQQGKLSFERELWNQTKTGMFVNVFLNKVRNKEGFSVLVFSQDI